MIVGQAHYSGGVRHELLPRDEPPTGDGFTWVSLINPEPYELAQLAERFQLHPLAVSPTQTASDQPVPTGVAPAFH